VYGKSVLTVRCSVIDGDWSATYLNATFGACRHFDVVVSGAIVCDVFEAFWQDRNQLFVKGSGHTDGVIRTIEANNIVVFSSFTFLKKFFS
jgi:hypothetical protein